MTDIPNKGVLSKLLPSFSLDQPKISELPHRIMSSNGNRSPPYQIIKETRRIVIRMTFPKTMDRLVETSLLEVDEHEIEFSNPTHHYHLKLHFPEQKLCLQDVDAVYYRQSQHVYIYLPILCTQKEEL
jgi:hypothetical protein